MASFFWIRENNKAYYEKQLAQLVEHDAYCRGTGSTLVLFLLVFTINRKVRRKMDKLLRQTKLFLRRNGSTILTYVGAVGVGATAVLAVKATPKALLLVDKAEEEKGEKLTKLEVVRVAGPAYIPAVLMGGATIACIFGANVLNKRQQASLMSAYALANRSYSDYKGKVAELYGDEANAQVRESIAKDKYEEEDIQVNEDEKLFYDDFSGRYFTSTIAKVQNAEYQLNRDLSMRDWATVNEFYEYLGIAPIDGGDELGWSTGMNFDYYWQSWIDFGHQKVVMDDGLECIIVTFFADPSVGWEDY